MYQFSCVCSVRHFQGFTIISHPFPLDGKDSSFFWVLSNLDLSAMDRSLVKTLPEGGAISCPGALDSVLNWSNCDHNNSLVVDFFNVHWPFLYGKWHRDSKSLPGNCCCVIPTAYQPNDNVSFWHYVFHSWKHHLAVLCC